MKNYVELNLNKHIMRGYENISSGHNCVVMFHGFTGNKTETNRIFYNIDVELEKVGISSLRFDWFGHGESDLDFSEITVDLLLEQAVYILEYAKKKYQEIYLLGFSMGGALAIQCLKYNPERLILISPAINMADKSRNYYNNCEKIGDNLVDFHSLKLNEKLVESFNNINYQDKIMGFDKPVLLIHGNKDLSVPIIYSKELYTKVNKGLFVEVDGADHSYSKVKYMEKISKELIKFLK